MTPQEMIPLLDIEPDPPPWDGEVQAIHATVLANRYPVRVRVLRVYEYGGRPKATVQALQGRPFPETNTWSDTWYSDTRHLQAVFLQEVTLIY